MYRWTGKEEDGIHLFPEVAAIDIIGVLLHHWNRTELNNLVIKFAHIIEIDD